MIYHSRAKRKVWSSKNTLTLFAIFLILFWLFGGRFAVNTISSISNSFYSLMPGVIKSAIELERENQILSEEVEKLRAENADRNTLASENELLKAGFGREENEKIVYAMVIKRPPNSPYDTFILDVGSELGIKENDEVIFGSVLVGKIVESGNGYSKARLLSSSGNTFEGILGESTNIKVKGLGGGEFEALLPLGVEVSSGDALILPSLSPKIFGLVQKIEDRSTEGFKRLLFSLPINPNSIRSVGIVVK